MCKLNLKFLKIEVIEMVFGESCTLKVTEAMYDRL